MFAAMISGMLASTRSARGDDVDCGERRWVATRFCTGPRHPIGYLYGGTGVGSVGGLGPVTMWLNPATAIDGGALADFGVVSLSAHGGDPIHGFAALGQAGYVLDFRRGSRTDPITITVPLLTTIDVLEWQSLSSVTGEPTKVTLANLGLSVGGGVHWRGLHAAMLGTTFIGFPPEWYDSTAQHRSVEERAVPGSTLITGVAVSTRGFFDTGPVDGAVGLAFDRLWHSSETVSDPTTARTITVIRRPDLRMGMSLRARLPEHVVLALAIDGVIASGVRLAGIGGELRHRGPIAEFALTGGLDELPTKTVVIGVVMRLTLEGLRNLFFAGGIAPGRGYAFGGTIGGGGGGGEGPPIVIE